MGIEANPSSVSTSTLAPVSGATTSDAELASLGGTGQRDISVTGDGTKSSAANANALRQSGVGAGKAALALDSGVGGDQSVEAGRLKNKANEERLNVGRYKTKADKLEKAENAANKTSMGVGIAAGVSTATVGILVACGAMASFAPVGTIIGAVGAAITLLCVAISQGCKGAKKNNNEKAEAHQKQAAQYDEAASRFEKSGAKSSGVGSSTLDAMESYQQGGSGTSAQAEQESAQ